jgi:hypothetical protein
MERSCSEIEHALSKAFANPSTALTHTTDSSGTLTIVISWVVAAGPMNILDERCMLSLALEPDVLGRYASLDTAARLRVRDALRATAKDKVRAHVPRGGCEITDCHFTIHVDASMVDDAAHGAR